MAITPKSEDKYVEKCSTAQSFIRTEMSTYRIGTLVVCYQESKYQKNWQDLRNSDLEVCCANIQPKLKNLRSSSKNQYFFMVSGGFLKFIQY